jgi:proteasome lid subunit RPN8/RPN11
VKCRITTGARDMLVAHALSASPRECCGLLIGRAGARFEVLTAYPAANLDAAPDRYLIDPADHFAARREARRRGLDVIGFFHSHPHGSAAPSSADLAEASYSNHLYVIVGLAPAAVRAFCFRDGRFDELALVLDEACER